MTAPNRHLGVLARIALLVALLDWVTKAVAARVVASEPVVVSRGLRFAVLHNDGTAFGFNAGVYTWQLNLALTLAAIVLMIPVARDLARIDGAAPRALGLIVGAATGNLASLLLPPRGVVDFISVSAGESFELVFNVADVAAYVGLAMLLRTGFLIVAEIRRTARPNRNIGVRHWASPRHRTITEREVLRPIVLADMVMTVNDSAVTRPESVRRAELIDLEAAFADPKVIDIRPHLAQTRPEPRSQRPESRRPAEERAD